MGMLFALISFIGLLHFVAFIFWAVCGAVMLMITGQRKPLKMWILGFFAWLIVFAGIFVFFKTTAAMPMMEFYLRVGAAMMEASQYFGCMVEFGPKIMSLTPGLCKAGIF